MKNKSKLSPGDFRELTGFVITSVPEIAKAIVEEHYKIISSDRDYEVFFNEMINPSSPNEALKKAAARYKSLVNSL